LAANYVHVFRTGLESWPTWNDAYGTFEDINAFYDAEGEFKAGVLTSLRAFVLVIKCWATGARLSFNA
jgi:hypothetical protein